jgi:hypothetical protein
LAIQDGFESNPGRVAVERTLASGHFVEHHAEGEEVGAGVELFATNLFGGHVAHGAGDHAGVSLQAECSYRLGGGAVGFGELGETEVENLDPAVVGHEEIFGLEIAVDDAAFVCCAEAVGDLLCVVQRTLLGNKAVLQVVA